MNSEEADLPEEDEDGESLLERAWDYREETLYPRFFGEHSRGIFTIPAAMITGRFKQESFDPRWLHCGVFEFAPHNARRSWLYVTSGMSNAWGVDVPNPRKKSGLGCEFIIETTQQADWAVRRLLEAMTFQILLCNGRYPGREPLQDFDRLPVREPIDSDRSNLTWMMVAPPPGVMRGVQMESGTFDFYQLVGISESEAAYGRAKGGDHLLNLLESQGAFPVTDPLRSSVVE